LLAGHEIARWADPAAEHARDDDEGQAWRALLDGPVRAALALYAQKQALRERLLSPHGPEMLRNTFAPPPPPATGYTSPLPMVGMKVDHAAVHRRLADAISALSERLGKDQWFLGSNSPTELDALLFAYLHRILQTPQLRDHLSRTHNLARWPRHILDVVNEAYHRST